eukprot:UN05271
MTVQQPPLQLPMGLDQKRLKCHNLLIILHNHHFGRCYHPKNICNYFQHCFQQCLLQFWQFHLILLFVILMLIGSKVHSLHLIIHTVEKAAATGMNDRMQNKLANNIGKCLKTTKANIELVNVNNCY